MCCFETKQIIKQRGQKVSLTEDQNLVANTDEHTMCCALPGSGKTHTVVSLADNLVKTDPSYRLLLITFTRAAAEELNERVKDRLSPSNASRVQASTFDSIFGQQVKNGKGKKTRTLVGFEQINFINRALRFSGFQESIDEKEALEWIEFYGRMLIPQPIHDRSAPLDNPENALVGWSVYDTYVKLMKKNNYIDFNGISNKATLGVQSGEIEPWPVTHILVDEFQDVGETQYAWLKAHGERGKTLIVTCDDDQSIYGFRGARSYEIMVGFQKDFSAVCYVLGICFRCRPEILASAKLLIEHNSARVPKDMESSKEAGGIVKYKAYKTEEDEFEGVIDAIKNNNIQWAVLARTNRILDSLEVHLRIHNIPYKRLGSKNLWDDEIANMLLKIFWSLIHPTNPRYIGEILGWLNEEEDNIDSVVSYMTRKKESFCFYMDSEGQELNHKVSELQGFWEEWGTDISSPEKIRGRLNDIQSFIFTSKKLSGRNKKTAEIVLDLFHRMRVDGGFIDRAKIFSKNLNAIKSTTEEEVEEGVVTLSSLHSSKGLQWSQVWLLKSSQGDCPSTASIENGDVSEERRLYYVGMTRAVDELYASSVIGAESQFLFEAGMWAGQVDSQ